MTKLSSKPVAFIDTETTGLNADHNEVIEFAAIIRKADGSESRVEFKVAMERPDNAHPKALEVNGYTPEAWVDAIPQKEAAQRMMDALKGCIIVGHNPSFDMDFIKATIDRELGKGKSQWLGYHRIDTVALAYEHLAPCGLEKLSLDKVCDFLGVTNKGAHTAMADVERCQAVYDTLRCAGWFKRLVWRLRGPKRA